MTPAKREKMTEALIPLIDAAMLQDADLRREAIVEGRIGVKEMDEDAFIDFAMDCYGVDEQDFCDQCGEPSNDGEGENGLCGNCADALHDEENDDETD